MDSKQIIAELRQVLKDFDDFRANAIECALLEPERIELSRAASRIKGAMTAAADLLEVGGWVSVEEKPPEYDKWIVARRRGRRPFTCRYVHVPDRFGGYAEFRDADGLVRDPTEWCSLPTPPGGDHD